MGNRKEEILIVALHLFARDGYEAVSVSQIAGKLDMTKGALYRHYKSKREIFDCIVQRMENLISWMREYNKSAGQGNDIRFYGFDMQRREYNYRYTVHYTEFFQEAIVYGHLQQNFMMR